MNKKYKELIAEIEESLDIIARKKGFENWGDLKFSNHLSNIKI